MGRMCVSHVGFNEGGEKERRASSIPPGGAARMKAADAIEKRVDDGRRMNPSTLYFDATIR